MRLKDYSFIQQIFIVMLYYRKLEVNIKQIRELFSKLEGCECYSEKKQREKVAIL